MKKNILKILSVLLIPSLLSGCRTGSNDDNKNTDQCYEIKSKKIKKQYVLNYDWNYKYYDFSSNTTFKTVNLVTSKKELSSSNNELIKYVYEQQFKGEMNPNGACITEDIFEEYDDAYFEDHILIIGATYENVGCTLYTTGVDNTTYKQYGTDSNGASYLKDTFTPFHVDTIFEDTSHIGKNNYRLIFFVYDEFKISESAYKSKTKSQIVSYFTNASSNTRLKYYNPYDIYKNIWNKRCPDNAID